MHGEGIYIDIDNVKWEGIFINGCYESKIQKKQARENTRRYYKLNQYIFAM